MANEPVAMPKRVVLKGTYGRYEEAPIAAADDVLKPGMIVEEDASGEYDQVAGLAANVCKQMPIILLEDALQGKTVADAYKQGATGFSYIPLAGDVVYILVASGETVNKNTILNPAGGGSGLFAAGAVGDAAHMFMAEEQLNGGSALAADTLCRARKV